jgi:DNA-binding response OmpR family regulator
LVVDNRPGPRTSLTRGLEAQGFDVIIATDGRRGLELGRTGSFDVIILNVTTPQLPEYEVLRQIRSEDVLTPILLLSAHHSAATQAKGLDLGADGYLVKPFSFLVLVAQLRALLRTHARRPAGEILQVGQLRLDATKKLATYHKQSVRLSNREFGLLYTLAGHPDTTFTKDELRRLVWRGSSVTDNCVEVHIRHIRQKLETVRAGHLVRNRRGHGYSLTTTTPQHSPTSLASRTVHA